MLRRYLWEFSNSVWWQASKAHDLYITRYTFKIMFITEDGNIRLIAPFLYSFELNIRIRKKNTVKGSNIPIPKHTLQTVSRWSSPAADMTIRNTETARGPPNYHLVSWWQQLWNICNTYAQHKISDHYEYWKASGLVKRSTWQLYRDLKITWTTVLDHFLVGSFASTCRRGRVLATDSLAVI